MSKIEATSRPFGQTAHQRAELDALRRMLDLSEGTFSLSVAICNSPALRDYIIEHVTSQTEGIEVVRIPEDARDVFDLVRQQIPNGSPRAICVTDLEKALAEDRRSRVMQGLNVSREQWRLAFQCPVVFWLPEYVITLLMTEARDLWSWVSHHFEFASEQAAPLLDLQESLTPDFGLAGNLDIHEKHFRIAELEQRIAEIGVEPEGQLGEHLSLWLNELAYLYSAVGELEKAEQLFERAIEISRRLGQIDGMLRAFANRGTVDLTRGRLVDAERVFHKALEICQKLGYTQATANLYNNLGLVHRTRADLDKAEEMHRKALGVYQELGQPEGVASAYGNLGTVYLMRGSLDDAEEMLRHSLHIYEKCVRFEGMASQYNNLGLVHRLRGNLDEAEKMHNKALEIYRRIGRLEGVAGVYGNLGAIHFARGNLDKTKEMVSKAIQIQEKLGQPEGVANSYANLAHIHKARGEYADARSCWAKALLLFQEVGARERAQAVQALIDALPNDGQ